MGNRPLEQPLVYEVYYNGTTINVTSPTTMLRFLAPSLPDGVFADNITVMVTAINRFGRGTPSDSDSVEISELHSLHIYRYIICNIYNMGTRALPDMYALSPRACGPWAYISGKAQVPML